MSLGSDGPPGRLRIGYGRFILAPLVPLALLAVTTLAGVDPGAEALVLILLIVTLLVTLLVVFSPPIVVDGGRLAVEGREDRVRQPGGAVDLAALVRISSVSYHGGLVSRAGLALFRNRLLLEDGTGRTAMFWAWGWTPKAALQQRLRDAVVASGATMDPMSFWRLSFPHDQGRVSRLRRFV